MKRHLLYSLIASCVVVATAAVTSALVLTWVPRGRARDAAERYLIAPGAIIHQALAERPAVRRLKRAGEKELAAGERALGREVPADWERRPHLYNLGVWAGAGFALCLVMTMIFGVSSFKSALALGVKVTLTLVFLQGALVFAGVLAYQKMVH